VGQQPAKSYMMTKRQNLRKKALTKAIGESKNRKSEIEFDKAQSMEELKWRKKDQVIAAKLGQELVRQYPGHGWNVLSNSEQGVVNIYNQHLSGKYGWILKCSEISTSAGAFRKQVMRIGGEMLRRFKVYGDTMQEDELLNLQKDFAGLTKVDLS